jgi:hypothetical protein
MAIEATMQQKSDAQMTTAASMHVLYLKLAVILPTRSVIITHSPMDAISDRIGPKGKGSKRRPTLPAPSSSIMTCSAKAQG